MVETATKTEQIAPIAADAKPQAPPQGSARSRNASAGLPLRLISSTTIISVLLFAAANFAIEKYDPLERLFWTGLTGARQHIFVSKLPHLMTAQKSPDVLVLGTSVSLFAAVRADDELAGRKARWDFWYERNVILPYENVQFLEHHLGKWAGKGISVTNASVAGSLLSDQLLILKKFLASGKRTKALVVCLSPRDFLDNSRVDLESTPTANALSDWSSLPELLSSGASWQSITNEVLGNISSYYQHRQEYSQFLTNLAARTLNRPVTLFEATKQAESRPAQTSDSAQPSRSAQTSHSGQTSPSTHTSPSAQRSTQAQPGRKRDTFFNPSNTPIFDEPPNSLAHLDEYKKMYLPVDKNQFQKQTEAFNSFLDLAKHNNIPVLIVSTPLPVENTNLLPKKTLAKYHRILEEGCARTGATLLTPDAEKPYDTEKYFEDASHMNTSGGIKFYSAIADALKANPKFAGLK